MYDESVLQRFIDLRVQGWSFARIAQELNVSKPTLVDWSRKHQHTIANLSAIEREARVSQVLAHLAHPDWFPPVQQPNASPQLPPEWEEAIRKVYAFPGAPAPAHLTSEKTT